MLGAFTVSAGNLATQRLDHATIEASLAAANEPSVPQRCNVAQDTLTRVLGRAPQTFSCTGIGTLVEVTASVLAPNYLPWGDASYPIEVSARAVVR